MRILLGTHLFPPHHTAGVETYTLQLARALAARHEVLVATTEKVISKATGARIDREVDGIRVVEIVNNLTYRDWSEALAPAAMERAFADILDAFRPDLVHLQHLMSWSTRLPEIAAARGVRVLMTLHDYWLECARFGQRIDADGRTCPGAAPERCAPCLVRSSWRQSARATRWIDRLVLVRALTGIPLDAPMRGLERAAARLRGAPSEAPPPDAAELALWRDRHEQRRAAMAAMFPHVERFLTPSRTLRAAMIGLGIEPDRIEHVPQGLDDAPFAGAAPREPHRPLRLGFIGTLAPHKGLHVLLEAFSGLPPGAATLRVHGPSRHHREYAGALERRFADTPGVTFGGPLSRPEVPRVHRELDLLCVPSLWNECCPLTIQEGFLARTPALVSDLGGMAELVAPGGGRAVPPGDVAAWRDALAALAADPAAVRALAASIPRVPPLAEHVARLEALYAAPPS